MSRRQLLCGGGVLLLAGVLLIALLRASRVAEIAFPDGRVFRIEATTFGTNHAVGTSDAWLVPLRKILSWSIIQHLEPRRGRSREGTSLPALVVWVHAVSAETGHYVDCQGMRGMLVDEQGDLFPAIRSSWSGFGGGFNRQAFVFEVFPRRSSTLRFELRPWRQGAGRSIDLDNPVPRVVEAVWMPEPLPAVHRVGDLEFTLERLTIRTNDGAERHWEPGLKLTRNGQAAANWEPPVWEAEDVTGNRGLTLGFHERLQKFIVTTRPTLAAVTAEADRWRLPELTLPLGSTGTAWAASRVVDDLSLTAMGFFPPGAYAFSQGQLTNATGPPTGQAGWISMSQQIKPNRWRTWFTFTATTPVAFVRRKGGAPGLMFALALRGPGDSVRWAQLSEAGVQDGVMPFVFEPPLPAGQARLEVILLRPVHTEFVVATPLP